MDIKESNDALNEQSVRSTATTSSALVAATSTEIVSYNNYSVDTNAVVGPESANNEHPDSTTEMDSNRELSASDRKMVMTDDSIAPRGLVDVDVDGPTSDVESFVHDQLPDAEELKASMGIFDNSGKAYLYKSRWFLIKTSIVISALAAFVGLLVLIITEKNNPNALVRNSRGGHQKRPSRMTDVVDFLSSHSKYNDLITPGTPQNLAAVWIADLDERYVSMDESAHKFLQRYALAVFYFSFGGPNYWPRSLRFLSKDDECTWFEVGFDELENALEVGASCKGTDEVRQLVFAPQYLRGNFPDELQLLSNLEHLSIFRNPGVTGSFPQSLRRLPKLEYLSLNYCTFDSRIPEWIGDLTSLTTLMLSNNHFIGSAPQSLGKLTNLKSLLLDDNSLLGNVNLFQRLTNLEILIAEDNFFHGELNAAFFKKLKHLKVLDLSNNQINSTLPNSMFSVENMTILDLHGNQLHGKIPDVVSMADEEFDAPIFGEHHMHGAMHSSNKLELLSLNENILTGTIPSTFAKLKKLDHLDLSNNMLSATIPSAIGTLSSLKYLFMAKNKFDEGLIPSFIGNLSNLRDLSLRATNRKGHIPHWLTKMTDLVLLDLHQNKLKGTIHDAFSKLKTMRYLLLNDNKLTGSIPTTFGSLSSMGLLLLEKNDMNGTADAICKKSHKPAVFITDCKGHNPEVSCECCTSCCSDADKNCNDVIALGDVDPVWERGFVRSFYNLGQVTLAIP